MKENFRTMFLIACWILVIINTGNLFAQSYSRAEAKEKRDSLINNSDYIFEVNGGGKAYYYVDEKGDVYCLKWYIINNVLKGDAGIKQTDDIYVISRAYNATYNAETGELNRYGNRNNNAGAMEVNFGVIFCKKGERPVNRIEAADYSSLNNPSDYFVCKETSIKGIGIEKTSYRLAPKSARKYGYTGEYYGLYGLNFKDKNDYYSFLSEYDGITIPEGAGTDRGKKSSGTSLKSGSSQKKSHSSQEEIRAELNRIKFGTAEAPTAPRLKSGYTQAVNIELGCYKSF